ncbi:hypothetical protein HY991_02380 [Candidatus Micrarchaeota archaeon]|nr:hypothetical protein [Candidatus Micrarchaeota archaeon]
MKTPFCENCLETGVFCPSCSEKLNKEELTETDLGISRLLHKYKRRFYLDDVVFLKSLDLGKFVLIFTATDASFLIGRGGKIVNELKKDLGGRKVKIIQRTADVTKMAEEILAPVRPMSINTVFKPDGRKAFKVRIMKKDAPLLQMEPSELRQAFSYLLGAEAFIIFD